MPLVEDPTGAVIARVLAYHNQRHDVIASNLANSNTPGYRAFDLVLREEIEASKKVEPLRTHPQHLSLDPTLGRISGEIERSDAPGRLDGNNVSPEQEVLKLTENRVRYEAAMELYDRWGSLMRVARETQ
jgi:flagellar basal-body rod protein FlgB